VDFEYTPEQEQLRREVREFAAREIAPHVMEWDENQIFPLEVIKKLGELGYMGAIFPEEYGGAGLGYVEYAIIIEELSRPANGSAVGLSQSPKPAPTQPAPAPRPFVTTVAGSLTARRLSPPTPTMPMSVSAWR
jgi:alkylation response protein AidB-like acyl-CoA dehydrogenase